MDRRHLILVIDDWKPFILFVHAALGEKYEVRGATSPGEGLKLAHELQPHVTIIDQVFPGDRSGSEIVGEFRQISPRSFIAMVSGEGEVLLNSSFLAGRERADVFFEKGTGDFSSDLLSWVDESIAVWEKLWGRADIGLTDDIPAFAGMVGDTPVMKDLFQGIREVSEPGANLLITGESGTGKELAAKAVHACSARTVFNKMHRTSFVFKRNPVQRRI